MRSVLIQEAGIIVVVVVVLTFYIQTEIAD